MRRYLDPQGPLTNNTKSSKTMEESHPVYNNIVDPEVNVIDEVLRDLESNDRAFIKHRRQTLEGEQKPLKKMLKNEIQRWSWQLQKDYLSSTNGIHFLTENNASLEKKDALDVFGPRDASSFLKEQKKMLDHVNKEKDRWLVTRLQEIYREKLETWVNFKIAGVDKIAADFLPHWIDRERIKSRLEDARRELDRITSIRLTMEVENNRLRDQLASMTNEKLNAERKANELTAQRYSETENLKAQIKKMRTDYEVEKLNAERKANELSVQRYSEIENLRAEVKKLNKRCNAKKLTIALLTKDQVSGSDLEMDSDDDEMEESTAKNVSAIPDHAKSSSSSSEKETSGNKKRKK